MTVSVLQSICEKLPGATSDVKWEHNLCYTVGGKIFIIISLDTSPTRASFKTTEEIFYALTEQDTFIPAPYLARNKWVMVKDISSLSKEQWEKHIELSYGLIKKKLPKKLREQLDK